MTINVRFENSALCATVEQTYEFEEDMTLEELNSFLLTEADELMREYCDDEEEEEDYLGGTIITILK